MKVPRAQIGKDSESDLEPRLNRGHGASVAPHDTFDGLAATQSLEQLGHFRFGPGLADVRRHTVMSNGTTLFTSARRPPQGFKTAAFCSGELAGSSLPVAGIVPVDERLQNRMRPLLLHPIGPTLPKMDSW